jgi:hypothetical protein
MTACLGNRSNQTNLLVPIVATPVASYDGGSLAALRCGPTPAGVASISRGSSAATPPVKCEESSRTPAGVPAPFELRDGSVSAESSHCCVLRAKCRSCMPRCCDPSGVGFASHGPRNRGCRFAQSPANRWHPCRGACRSCERDVNWAVRTASCAAVLRSANFDRRKKCGLSANPVSSRCSRCLSRSRLWPGVDLTCKYFR